MFSFPSGSGQSVRQHMLTNYFHAILAVVLAQFRGLGFLDGMEGIIRLAEASPYFKVKCCMNNIQLQTAAAVDTLLPRSRVLCGVLCIGCQLLRTVCSVLCVLILQMAKYVLWPSVICLSKWCCFPHVLFGLHTCCFMRFVAFVSCQPVPRYNDMQEPHLLVR